MAARTDRAVRWLGATGAVLAALAAVLPVVTIGSWSITVGSWARHGIDIQVGDAYYLADPGPALYWLGGLVLAALIGAAAPRWSLVGAVAAGSMTLHALLVVGMLFSGVRITDVRWGSAWYAAGLATVLLALATLAAWAPHRARRAARATPPDPRASGSGPTAA